LAFRAAWAHGGGARRHRLGHMDLARGAILEQGMNKHIGVDAPLGIASLREDFPILATKVYGKPLVYLDNAASAQKPKAVVERMLHATYHEYANVHRGLHYLANAATDAYEAARESLRAFLNAGSASEIVFTKSATEAINLVAASFGEAFIKEGDEIVLSIMEHHANIVPWHFLRARRGAVLKWVDIDDEGNFLLDAFDQPRHEGCGDGEVKAAVEAVVERPRAGLLGDGDRGQPEHDALERGRDGAGVGDVIAEVRPVVDAGDDQVGRETLDQPQAGEANAVDGSAVRGVAHRAVGERHLGHPQRPARRDRARHRRAVAVRGDHGQADVLELHQRAPHRLKALGLDPVVVGEQDLHES